ncbi:MAG: serine hydrolase [Gemmatimonadaceae bacterium]|nr:serine hydrolase [Gemmatimonadaceae bacterium]
MPTLRFLRGLPPALCLLAAPLSAQTADLCRGHYAGSIALPTGALAFDVDLTRGTDGRCTGDISIPAQRATDLPLANLSAKGDSISFEIGGVPGTPKFAGALEKGSTKIAGVFTQGGGRFPFTMSAGQSAADAARTALAGFDAWADSLLTQWKLVGMGIGIVVDGQLVYAKGHGFRDRDLKLPVTPNTLFAIGSSSKAFTTFAMGTLVDEGKLQWDVPVRTYLPWFAMHDPAVTERITPRDLVTHRSGLPRHDYVWYNNTTATREELVRRVRYLPLSRDLRQEFQYNNLMFLSAGYLVGHLTGSTWEDGLRRQVLGPLKMTRTNFSVAQSKSDPDHSEPYRVRKDTIEQIPFRDISLVGPAGSINSTITDMAQWVTLHLNGGKLGDTQVIKTGTLRDMYRPYTPISGLGDDPEQGPVSYGLGWFVTTWRGHYFVHHGGNIDGFSALVAMFPHDKIGIVVLTNQNGSAVPTLVVRHAADRLFGATRRDWNREALARAGASNAMAAEATAGVDKLKIPGTKPSRPLSQFAGTYADSGYGPLEMTLQKDTLVARYNGISAPLGHWHYDTFVALRNPVDPALEGTQFTFRTGPSGRIEAVQLRTDPLVPETQFRRQPDPRLRDAAYLARFVGRYAKGPANISLAVQGNRLLFSQGPMTSPITPQDDVRWSLDAQPAIQMEFVTDAKGAVTHLRVIQGGGVVDLPRAP